MGNLIMGEQGGGMDCKLAQGGSEGLSIMWKLGLFIISFSFVGE